MAAAMTLVALGSTLAASSYGSTSVCGVPAGEHRLARHGDAVTWQDPTVEPGNSGGVYGCSARHPDPVTLLTVSNDCISATFCPDDWNYADVRFAGPWVVASASLAASDAATGLWDTRGGRVLPIREPWPIYALVLRADGAMAWAYQAVNTNFDAVDSLGACTSRCHQRLRLDRFVEPDSYLGVPLLFGVHFGAHEYLLWRDAGHQRTARIR